MATRILKLATENWIKPLQMEIWLL